MRATALIAALLLAPAAIASPCYRADVDETCSVNDADITAAIDCVLFGGCGWRCDANADDACNVSDIVAVIALNNAGTCEPSDTICGSCADWGWWDGGVALMEAGQPPWLIVYGISYEVTGGDEYGVDITGYADLTVSITNHICADGVCWRAVWIDCVHDGCQAQLCAWLQ